MTTSVASDPGRKSNQRNLSEHRSHGDPYQWPYAKTAEGETVNMRNVASPESRTWDLHYGTEFAEGWLAVTDTSRKVGFGMVFPKDIFRCIWLWLVYGGWREHYCVAVEAWTGSRMQSTMIHATGLRPGRV